jgi:uncharacterized membrane protein SpoIIM required for sporulation
VGETWGVLIRAFVELVVVGEIRVSALKVAGSLCSGAAVIYVLIMNGMVLSVVARWRGGVAQPMEDLLEASYVISLQIVEG